MVNSWVLKTLFGFTIIYTVALTIGSLIKPVEIDTTLSYADKILHTGAYAGLTFLWLSVYQLFSSKKQILWTASYKYFLIMILIVIFGVIIEVLQGSITSYRTADTWDAIANTAGVLFGSIMFLLFFKKIMKLKSTN